MVSQLIFNYISKNLAVTFIRFSDYIQNDKYTFEIVKNILQLYVPIKFSQFVQNIMKYNAWHNRTKPNCKIIILNIFNYEDYIC